MKEENVIGIYCIENLVNHKKYIGQSVNIKRRWRVHISYLNKNAHQNNYLQNSWNKYGKNNFRFYIVHKCKIEKLNELEKYYIDLYKSLDRQHGYNIDDVDILNNGRIVSKETRLKLSNNHVDFSGIKNPMYGVKMSDESKLKTWNNENYINRKYKGSENGNSKLTENDVIEIKKYFSDKHELYKGETTDVAKKYGVTRSTINNIYYEKTWKWLVV